jgi:hypothetical protein
MSWLVLPFGRVQPQPPGHNVAGHLGEPPVLRVRVCPQPRERLGGRDPSSTTRMPVA